MDNFYYIIIAIVIIFIFGPALFADRSPIPETSGNIHKISESSQLNALLSTTRYVVVDFYADWCPPCRAIAPVFSKLADEYASKSGPRQLAFAKVNVDSVKDVAHRYNVTAMPTFVVFKDGKPSPVVVRGDKQGASARVAGDGLVERIQGANVALLRSVVRSLAEEVQG
ncbi:hypothetical protein FQN55_002709 [Onygenales sp. PD_40]|nr:hypothetical protein FQN55_002709 [Onygenales sp. PD_40]KAK2772172.1 hypothetical protein FQN53_004703 [Emmonsiellopsis sp. PD_33]